MYGVEPEIFAIAHVLPANIVKLLCENRDVLGGIGLATSGNSLRDPRVGRRGPPAGIRCRLSNCRYNSGNCKAYLYHSLHLLWNPTLY